MNGELNGAVMGPVFVPVLVPVFGNLFGPVFGTTSVDWVYQAIMGVAILTGVFLSRGSQRQLNLPNWQRYGVLFGALCGAMLGAKLPFVLSDWEGFLSGVAWFQDGKTILCGLAGGYLGVEVAKWSLDVTTRTGDSFAVPVAASVAVGRLGCFRAGCCYGTPTNLPWAVVFPNVDQLARHPTQLYESLFHLTAAIVLAMLKSRGIFRGNLIKLYIISYAVYRLISETIRPEARLWGGLTGYQWSALALIGVFATLWHLHSENALESQRFEKQRLE